MSSDGSSITIQKVIVGPGQTLVDYEMSDSGATTSNTGGAVGIPDASQITLFNGDTGKPLRVGGGGGPIDVASARGNTAIQMFQKVFITPNPLPADLTIKFGLGGTEIQVPLH